MSIVISGTTGIDLGHTPASNVTDLEVEGNLTLSGTGNRITGDFSNTTISDRVAFQTSTPNSVTVLGVLPNGTATSSFFTVYNNSDTANSSVMQISARATTVGIDSRITGTGAVLPLVFYMDGSERMRIDTSGNVLVTGTGLGYGAGSGGTVTQLTSKSTAVTLNKPSGQIIMNNAALAAGATVYFTLSNSLIEANDFVNIQSDTYAGYYRIATEVNANGSCLIHITNVTGASRSDIFNIKFNIIKGAIS